MKYKVGDKVKVVASGEIVEIEGVGTGTFPYRARANGREDWWRECIFEPLTLKEQYFQTGYVVETRYGTKYIVLRNGDKVALADLYKDESFSEWACFGLYDGDLKYGGLDCDQGYDIVAVYDRVCRWEEDELELIWQREEPKEMTIEEIEKLVGTKVKIIGNQEGRE